jgi:pSer/pThr/pTyr-binding forkhead associated (FHA) protein
VQGKPEGSELEFPEGEFVVGRGPECHVRLNSELVSRQHCLLMIHEGVMRVRDLGSTNGTLVNADRVVDEREVSFGERLRLGQVVFENVTPQAPTKDDMAALTDTDMSTLVNEPQ